MRRPHRADHKNYCRREPFRRSAFFVIFLRVVAHSSSVICVSSRNVLTVFVVLSFVACTGQGAPGNGTAGTSGPGSAGTLGGGGTSGSAGTSGTGGAGTAGTLGTAGSTGAAGTTGTAGTMGNAGNVGASGSAGTGGVTGNAGNGGTTGSAGNQGTSGSTGAGGGGGMATGVAGAGGRGGTGVGGAAGNGGRGGTAGTGTGGASGTAGRGGTGAGGIGAAGTGGGSVAVKLIGFATLNGGTTGGLGGQTVTASTYAQLKSYAESATTYIIMVEGTISNGANGGTVSVKSNKSLIGVGTTAFLFGVGLNISNSNNIIIQNLRLSMTGVTTRTDTAGVYSSTGDEGSPQILVNGGDTISISGTSKNIWIDHCELFSEDPTVQTNHDLYDGLIDVKGQTGFITISWCYLHDHHKGGLVGASDTDLYDDRKITYHHNYYNKVLLRIPMYRGAVGHFFNNYIVGATDASEIRANTCLRVEKNYYEALHYSIYTTSDAPGSTERIDNVEVSRTSRAYPANCTADIPYPYADALTTTTNDVKTVVPRSAGVGKI
jgi:pectate lyase